MSLLCYSVDGTGVHLTEDGRTTFCGLAVIDIPTFPRTIESLSCVACERVGDEHREKTT